MRKHTAWMVAAVGLMASSAHADNGELPASIVVGTSAGTASQTASDPLSALFGVPIGKDVNLATMHLHAGVRLPDGWLEPGVDVEMARGSGVESYAAFGDLRLHLGPSWRVHPTLLVGLGEVIEHGTDTMDVKTGARGAFMMGPGLQVRI